LIQESSAKAWDIMLDAAECLMAAGIVSAREEAELLLADITGWDRSALYIDRTKILSLEQKEQYDEGIRRRTLGEPYAYIVGYRNFYKHNFKVTADTLIPRGDSEALINAVLSHVGQDQTHRILDLGTGSGCLILSLLHEMQHATGVGVDFNPAALAVAAENAVIVGCNDRVRWQQSNWFDDLDEGGEPFSILISNPPYIPSEHIDVLDVGVKSFEPRLALDGGQSGLDSYEKILKGMSKYVTIDSLIIFEVGIYQAKDLSKMLQEMGLRNIKIFKDLDQIDRVVSAIYV
jgi:release factor glutamine methyltransferase